MLSQELLTPEQEAYAKFMEQALRSFFRFDHKRMNLRRRYGASLIPDENLQRVKAILDTLDDQQYQGVQEIVHDSMRHAICGILFQIKPYEVRDWEGVQLDFENGLDCDVHYEWLSFTEPVKVRSAWDVPPRPYLNDWKAVKSIEQENWRRYIVPIIGSDAVEAWLALRHWNPGTEKVIVAEPHNWDDIIGFASVTVDSESQEAEVTALHVTRFFRGRYLGKQLMGAAAQVAQEAGACSLSLWTLEDNTYTVDFCEKRKGEKRERREAAYAPGFYEVKFRWDNLEVLVEEGHRYT